MEVDPGKDSVHCLLNDSKVDVSKRNNVPAFGDNTATNSDGLINSNKIIVNKADVKPEVVESAENIEDLDEQSKYSAGNDNSESLKIESQVSKIPVEEEKKAKRIKLEKEVSAKDFVVKKYNKYTCGVCNHVNTKSIYIIADHLRKKYNICLYICDICSDYFINETDLSHHMEDHVAKQFNFDCDVCIKIFTRLQLLCPDKEAHYESPEIFWPCPNCCLEFDTKKSLKKHIKKTHTKKERYICRGCDACKDKIKHTYEPGELEAQMFDLQHKLNMRDHIPLFQTSYRDKLNKESLIDYNDHYYKAKFWRKEVPLLHLKENNSEKVSISEIQEGNKNIDIQFARRDGSKYTCLICRGNNKESRDANSILAHLKEEHDCCFYTCDICRKYFRKRRDLISMRYNNLSPPNRFINCKKCLDTCSRLQLFRIHKHFHYPDRRALAMRRGAYTMQMDDLFS